MKYFYINNDHCTACNRCVEGCPERAVYEQDEMRYVNYEKCVSCGKCMDLCNDNAVIFEGIDRIVHKMEHANSYRSRLRRAEKELALIKERFLVADKNLDMIIQGMPMAAALAERDGRIVSANGLMIEMSGIDELRRADMPYNLAGERISSVLPETSFSKLKLAGLEDTAGTHVAEISGRPVSITITPLAGSNILYVVRDLRDKNIAADQVLALLNDSIDRKMAMVQKIGSLLGEETTSEINNINSAIRIIGLSGGRADD